MDSQQPIENMKFPAKLWHIATHDQTGALWWNSDGDSIILNIPSFEDNYLKTRQFKTEQFGSLVRQLNLYSFVQIGRTIKIRNIEDGGAVEAVLRMYKSPLFKRDRPDLLRRMRRGMGGHGHHKSGEGPCTCRTFCSQSRKASASSQEKLSMPRNLDARCAGTGFSNLGTKRSFAAIQGPKSTPATQGNDGRANSQGKEPRLLALSKVSNNRQLIEAFSGSKPKPVGAPPQVRVLPRGEKAKPIGVQQPRRYPPLLPKPQLQPQIQPTVDKSTQRIIKDILDKFIQSSTGGANPIPINSGSVSLANSIPQISVTPSTLVQTPAMAGSSASRRKGNRPRHILAGTTPNLDPPVSNKSNNEMTSGNTLLFSNSSFHPSPPPMKKWKPANQDQQIRAGLESTSKIQKPVFYLVKDIKVESN